jgi:hypothetical protein
MQNLALAPDKYYFTGKPCRRGHVAWRQRSNLGCVECIRLNNLDYYYRGRGELRWWARKAAGRVRTYAKKHEIIYTVTPGDILAIIPADRCCPILGTPLVFSNSVCRPDSPSVDRIIPVLGYVPGNVQVISMRANNLKSNCTNPDDLRRVANWLERNL